MTDIAVYETEHFKTMEDVADRFLEKKTPLQISKELGIPRKVVLELIDEYKNLVMSDTMARDLARDHLNEMIEHYKKLSRRYYALIDEIDLAAAGGFSPAWAAQKNSALKEIANLDAKVNDALRQAGLLDASDLGDELAEREEKERILIGILRHDLCKQCQDTVARKLQEVTNITEATVVYDS